MKKSGFEFILIVFTFFVVVVVPHLASCIFLFFYNEQELGVGINPGMALSL